MSSDEFDPDMVLRAFDELREHWRQLLTSQ
jgi:hypothetical protein